MLMPFLQFELWTAGGAVRSESSGGMQGPEQTLESGRDVTCRKLGGGVTSFSVSVPLC